MLTSAYGYWQLATRLSAFSNSNEATSKNSTAENEAVGGRIIIIDDDPTQRLVAARDMRKIGADTVMPETVSDLLTTIDPDSVGLCITDRWLGDQWHAAADEFIGRLPPHVPVWEWTCDQWGQPILHRVERVIFKRPGELLAAVKEWIERKV